MNRKENEGKSGLGNTKGQGNEEKGLSDTKREGKGMRRRKWIWREPTSPYIDFTEIPKHHTPIIRQEARRFVVTRKTLTPQEIQEYRDFGLIPEPTLKRKVKFVLDMETLRKLEEARLTYNKALALNLNKSEFMRLMILEELKAIREDRRKLESTGNTENIEATPE